ncbi:MAG TPA: DEAD/DEAH box helicase [Thermoplasmatales archaeon]|nr:DEAD/DEAH box helicase [Thermoplasmatales archaeon]
MGREVRKYIEHELIQPFKIEKRLYQLNIYNEVKDKNSLVVLPTGLGKTVIATLVLIYKLSQGKKVLFLAPTKPLCEQHASMIKNVTTLSENDVVVVTGETCSPKKRKKVYGKAKVVVATPQTIQNDIGKRLFLSDYGLIILDEAHRAVGDYSYVKIIERYRSLNDHQILGLTASPGSDFEKLKEVAVNLGIKHVEIRNEWDEDVKPYLSSRYLQWQLIEMPVEVKEVMMKIDIVLQETLQALGRYTSQAKHLTPDKLSKKALVEIQNRMKKNLGRRGGSLYHGLTLVSTAIKLSHLRDILTSQGVEVAKKYVSKLDQDDSKAAKRIREHLVYQEIKKRLDKLRVTQPKLEMTKDIINSHLKKRDDARVMVFAEYRDTVEMLVSELNKLEKVQAVRFIGQTTTAGKGMTQMEQKQTLDDFRRGRYNVLVSTSIGEEGIDIPSTSLVLFYEPVPSAIRHIQRKGRTGRDGHPGEVKILIMKDSRDEAYYWSSIRREKKMYSYVYKLKDELEGKTLGKISVERQSKIDEYLH